MSCYLYISSNYSDLHFTARLLFIIKHQTYIYVPLCWYVLICLCTCAFMYGPIRLVDVPGYSSFDCLFSMLERQRELKRCRFIQLLSLYCKTEVMVSSGSAHALRGQIRGYVPSLCTGDNPTSGKDHRKAHFIFHPMKNSIPQKNIKF